MKVSEYVCTTDTDTKAERDRVLLILYLLDKFGVGDAFYHELTMIDKSLPRSYSIKQARKEYNSRVELQPIPGFDGVYRSFESTFKEILSVLVSSLYPQSRTSFTATSTYM